MSDLRSKVAYLQGLAEGLDVEMTSSEGRILASMIDVLGEMAEHVEEIAEAQDELAEYVEDVDYDLGALEESVYADEETDEDEEVTFVPEEWITQREDGMEIVACPQCGEAIGAGFGDVDAQFQCVCPSCGCIVEDAGDFDQGFISERD